MEQDRSILRELAGVKSVVRWEAEDSGYIARVGRLAIGAVGPRGDRWYFNATWAVRMIGVAEHKGEVSTLADARKAVEHAWGKWVALACLAVEQQIAESCDLAELQRWAIAIRTRVRVLSKEVVAGQPQRKA